MKKVININFQGRVVPIEETAYDILKQYIESLRRYFANEEGRDEIINDIEGRIAELFSERLSKGTTCITDADVNAVIAGMGRPEDFDAADTDSGATAGASTKSSSQSSGSTGSSQQTYSSYNYTSNTRGRFIRNADDKIIGGVCSGLANYFGIDPVVMRIVFVILFGALFWVYILLWIIVPSQSLQTNITKRLYRSSDDKVISGVCGGLAAYFNIDTWIPRLIFALPLIVGLISGPLNFFWNHWDIWMGPKIITGSLSSTLFIAYIILWIAVPVATTAAEKLEMKGERIDLNSIRNTVKEDLESFKTKAEKWGSEVKESAKEFGEKAKDFGQTAGTQARNFTYEAGPVARSAGSGIGHVIAVLFKAFFLFIAGIIALSLFGVLIGLLFAGFFAFPIKDFFLEGFGQNLLAWATLVLFLGIPLIALITWLVRRIMGVRSKKHYLGFVFGTLWIVGLICVITLAGMFARNYKTRSAIEEPYSITQPATGKLYVDVTNSNIKYYNSEWLGVEWDGDWPVYGVNQDTLMLNTVRVNLVKSPDDNYHVTKVRLSRGNTQDKARNLAERIRFDINQKDSFLLLPERFAISSEDRFRNQQVMIVIEIPVGKKIQLGQKVSEYDWFTVNFNNRRGWNIDNNQDWNNSYDWQSNKEYIMTPENGLVRTSRLDADELKRGRYKVVESASDKNAVDEYNEKNETVVDTVKNSKPGYRYKGKEKTDTTTIKVDTTVNATKVSTTKITAVESTSDDSEDTESSDGASTKRNSVFQTSLYFFGRLFQQ
ncbi:MAG: PspC domain-containing protein [Chitinophagaceae bacterium]|nr:PspC domain-containing protein [Chitinophagaceae bacterium]